MKIPSWQKIATTGVLFVVFTIILNRVMAAQPAVAKIING